jgi:hypothetical protein
MPQFDDLLNRFGIQPSPTPGVERPTPLDRIWLPPGNAPDGVPHPTSLGCYGEMPRDPHFAVRVQTGMAFTLTLDKEWTTPQALIGVKFGSAPGSRTDCTVLVPGQTLHVPNGFTEFWAYAADDLDIFGFPNPDDDWILLGYVSFIVGRSLGATPNPREPHPHARVLSACNFFHDQTRCAFVPSPNVKAVRCRFHSQQVEGVVPVGAFTTRAVLSSYERERFFTWDIPLLATESPDSNALGTHNPWRDQLMCGDRRQIISSARSNHWVPNNIAEAIFTPIPGTMNTVHYESPALLNFPDEPAMDPAGQVPLQVIIEAVDNDHGVPDKVLLYQCQQPQNDAFDTGYILADDIDELLISIYAPAAIVWGAGAILFQEVDEHDQIHTIWSVVPSALPTPPARLVVGWGPGCSSFNGSYTYPVAGQTAFGPGPLSLPVPKVVRLSMPVLNAAVATNYFIRVLGLRRSHTP